MEIDELLASSDAALEKSSNLDDFIEDVTEIRKEQAKVDKLKDSGNPLDPLKVSSGFYYLTMIHP